MIAAQDILDALATAVLVLDADLTVVDANSAAQSLFGVSLNQVRGRPFRGLLHDSDSLEEVLRRAVRTAQACAQREVVLHPLAGGEARIADVCAAPLDAGGERRLLVEIGDATQRRRISRDAALLAQLDGSRLMIRQLAHEINNPLGGLRGAAQLLARQLGTESLREYTAVIINESDRLAALVDSMLGPNRQPQRESVNVHELCEHVFHLLRSEASAGVVVIERDYDPSVPEAKLDRHMIVQVMLNLGRNALQAIADRESSTERRDNEDAAQAPGRKGRIVLRTRVLTNQSIGTAQHRLVAAVQFEDDGPGVPDALRETLFYPLVTGRAQGTGLGLAVAQDLVSRHEGLIEFESRPGHTLFTILLPIPTADAMTDDKPAS